jgi:hypothetical protein
MARNLAEGGMRQMFKLMLKVMVENVEEEQMMRLSGQNYQPIDPRSWNTGMDVTVNVGLGTGREEQKLAALSSAFQIQTQIIQNFGLSNGMVSLTQIRNTLSDMLALNGIRNANRYFMPMDQQTEQMIAMQAQQAQQQPPQDAQAQAYLQAEAMKTQAKAQTDMAKIQAQAQKDQFKLQLDATRAAADDDLARDKMDQDLLVSAAEIIGKYGTAVDIERIKQMQNAPR